MKSPNISSWKLQYYKSSLIALHARNDAKSCWIRKSYRMLMFMWSFDMFALSFLHDKWLTCDFYWRRWLCGSWIFISCFLTFEFQNAELFRNYLKQIREETSGRLLSVAYRPNGTPNKWWLAFAKRKFMNIIVPWIQFVVHPSNL